MTDPVDMWTIFWPILRTALLVVCGLIIGHIAGRLWLASKEKR